MFSFFNGHNLTNASFLKGSVSLLGSFVKGHLQNLPERENCITLARGLEHINPNGKMQGRKENIRTLGNFPAKSGKGIMVYYPT